MSFISPFILFCYLYPPSLIKKIKIKKKICKNCADQDPEDALPSGTKIKQ